MNLRLTLLVAFFLGCSGGIAAPFVHPSLRFEALPDRARQPQEFLARSNGPGVRVSARNATFGAVRMQFAGANQDSPGAGIQPLPATSNYLFGSDQREWRSNISCFSQVRFAGVYPGVDLLYKGDGPRLEYDFTVSPYADPAAIGMVFPGAEVRVDDRGDLLVQQGEQALRFRAPVAYQESDHGRIEVPVQFAISRRKVRFRLGPYDRAKTLIIDPTLVYSTYLEASNFQAPPAVAVDPTGNVYVSGSTVYPGAPVTNQILAPCTGRTVCSAVFVDKFDSKGNLVYATLFGGSAAELSYALAVDTAGNAYITGLSTSSDFPVVNPLPQSKFTAGGIFVAKLNAAGSALTFSTYLNGSNNGVGAGIAVDSSGNIFVTGWTFSPDFPTVNATQPVYGGREDAFVAKIDPSSSTLVYSTYLGGANFDQGHGIAVDSSGNAYVTGYTGSLDFPTLNALQPGYAGATVDAFVAKISPTGTLLYSTYLGGSGNDQGNGIAVDSTGAMYVTGSTSSANFPTVSAVQAQYRATNGATNAFVTKIAPNGASLVYSTYLGGAGFDIGFGIAVDSSGNATVAGQTISPDFPTVNALQSVSVVPGKFAGFVSGGFVSKLANSGSQFVYSTYLSGSAQAEATAVALDQSGQVYVTGMAYLGFPVFNAYQPNATSTSSQSFLTRISDGSAACAFGISPTTTTLSALGAGGAGLLTLVANSSGCTWQASSNVPWLTITQGSSGIGIAPVGYAVAQNPAATPRTGVLTLAGQNITINQAASAHFTLGAASGVAGSVARIPLGFVPDQTPVVGFTVTIAVSPSASAPALSGALSFQASAALSPPQVTASAGQITLAWANLTPSLASSIALGEIVVPVPSTAVAGQVYTVQSTSVAVSLGLLAVAGAPATLTVANPAPLATWMTPSAAPAGSAATAVLVNGEGFSNASTVLWNGSALPTQFISETQLQVTIPASDLVAAATAQISVSNPAPGGGLSGTLSFLVASGTTPVINPGGVVDSARYGTSIVGGSIAAVFGTNLGPAHVPNAVLPLPTQLGGVMVLVDGVPAPLFDVTSTQITFQVPWRLLTKTQATVAVVVNGFTSNAVTVTSAAFVPAIFTTNSQGSGQGAVLLNSSATLVDSANPARAGDLINVYATGLGGTVASVADGTAGSGSVLAPNLPTATIGEMPAKVGFTGIAGYVGLYQINVTIPQGVPSGSAVPLVLKIGSVTSNTVTIAIQ